MNLIILGAGEYGQLVKEIAQEMYEVIDFLDDNSSVAIDKLGAYKNYRDQYKNAVVAIGNNEIRTLWIDKLAEAGYNLPSIISSSAFIYPSAIIESGCIIEPMAVINANAKVEKGSILSAGAVVNHNATVKTGCHVDCNAVVGADAIVPSKTHLYYGKAIIRDVSPCELGVK